MPAVRLALILLLAAAAPAQAAGDPARGLILVSVDTLRADHVRAYGGPVPTPAFDAVAAHGVLLEQAYTPTPTTGPAHASLLTGLHPWRHGVLDNAVPLPKEIPTLAEALRGQRFATAAFVSSYMLHPRFGLGRGFDRYAFEPTESYRWRGELRPGFWSRGGATVDAALAWLKQRAADGRPFFVFLHLFDPHTPYAPPVAYAVAPDQPVDLRGKQVPHGVPSQAVLKDLIRAYRGEVRYTDAQLGRLVAGLDRLGLLEPSVLVVTADHGEGLGDRGLLEHGIHLHEELVRVPLLLRGPGISAGRRLSGAVQLEDLLPTLLGMLGAPVPKGLDGADLGPWLSGADEASPRKAVVGRRKRYPGQPDLYFERRGARKWMGRLDGKGRVYDLDSDPRERRPGRGDSAPATLRADVEAGGRTAAPQVDPEVRRALEALGYAD